MSRSWIIAAVVAVAVVTWMLTGQIGDTQPAPAAGAPAAVIAPAAPDDTPLMRVRTRTIAAETITDTLIVQGRTMADRHVTVRAEIAGTVAAVLADRGDRLAAGDPILRLAEDDRSAALASAVALVAQRQIEYDAAARLNQRGHSADTEVAAARARLDQAIAERTLAEIAVDHLIIRAPFDGVLDDRLVEIGDYVDIGDTVAQVLDLDPIRVVGQISERHLGRIGLGTEADVDFLTGAAGSGAVVYIGRMAEETTRTFPVEVDVANPDYGVIAGLTAEILLPLGEVRAHLVSPAVLTLADDGTLGVKAIDGDDRVSFHAVEILSSDDAGVWLGGLPDRLRLITVGQEFVVPGQTVAPVDEGRVRDAPDTPGGSAEPLT